MYLPEAAVEETLRWVAAQASGSTIIFDFVGAMVIKFFTTVDLTLLPEAAQQAIGRLLKLTAGEPWIFGLPDAGEREFLAKLGLELRKLLPISGEEAMKRFLTRSDGTPYISLPPSPGGLLPGGSGGPLVRPIRGYLRRRRFSPLVPRRPAASARPIRRGRRQATSRFSAHLRVPAQRWRSRGRES